MLIAFSRLVSGDGRGLGVHGFLPGQRRDARTMLLLLLWVAAPAEDILCGFGGSKDAHRGGGAVREM